MRLLEINVPRSVIAHSIKGVASIRLVRKICPYCKINYALTEPERKILGREKSEGNFSKGSGCNKCHDTGYLGRTGIFNITVFNDEIRFNIINSSNITSLKELLLANKSKKFGDSAMIKIVDGTTTVEENMRDLGYWT